MRSLTSGLNRECVSATRTSSPCAQGLSRKASRRISYLSPKRPRLAYTNFRQSSGRTSKATLALFIGKIIMTDDLVVSRCVPLQGGSYIGLHRKDPEMAEKKKAKPAEVEGLVVKIGVDLDANAISEATAALKELATAANAARDALERLCGSETIVNVAAPRREIKIAGLSPEEYLGGDIVKPFL